MPGWKSGFMWNARGTRFNLRREFMGVPADRPNLATPKNFDNATSWTVEIYESEGVGVDRLVPVVFLRCIYFAKLVNRQISKRAQFHQIPMRSATFQA
jgi:hypothetical protein